MFAIGLVLFALGWFGLSFFDDPRERVANPPQMVGFCSFIIGGILLITSIVTLAWAYLP